MKRHPSRLTVQVAVISFLLVSCGDTEESRDRQRLPSLGSDETVEIVTWNIEQFPKNSSSTIENVTSIIEDLDADVYCIQEINNKGSFISMVEDLPDYDYVMSQHSTNLKLAILYKTSMFRVASSEELLMNYSYEFAGRPPLRVNFLYVANDDTLNFSIIDVHLKCCDSGFERRKESMTVLYDYLINQLEVEDRVNVIVAGDWNDELDDPESENAFLEFLEDTTRFYYADYNLATSGSSYYASYPSWASFIDHILISNSLFDEFETSSVMTIRLEDYIDGYESTVSDHRPVAWVFTPNWE